MSLHISREAWLASISGDHTGKTVHTYRDHTARFLRWWDAHGQPDVSVKVMIAYRTERNAVVKPVTTESELRTISSWFGWSVLMGSLPDNPCKALPTSPGAKLAPTVALSEADVEKALAVAKSLHVYGIVLTAIYSGLRKSELLQLTGKDIDLEHGVLWVRHEPDNGQATKSKKTRSVPLHPKVREWVETKKTDSVLFPLSGDQATRKMYEIQKLAELPHFTWKTCRHTFGSRLAQAGVNLGKIQSWMGHNSITTTMRYVHLVDGQYDDDVAKAL